MPPSLFQHLRQSTKHLVRETLGLKYAGGRTIFLGGCFILFGMGIGPTALEHFIDWCKRPKEDAHRFATCFWLLFSLAMLVLFVGLSYWWDRRFFLDEKKQKERYALTKRAIVMAPSMGVPSDAFLEHLETLERTDYLRELSYFRPGHKLPEGHKLAATPKAAPGWMELLGRIIEHHHGGGEQPKIEQVVLLLERSRCGDKGEEAAIARATKRLLQIVGQIHGRVRICAVDDMNDAEDVRKKTLGMLMEIEAETDIHLYEMAVDITGGTAAASVGMTLAAAELDVDVEYVSQRRPEPAPGAVCDDFGYLPAYLGEQGTWGTKPIRVFTDTHRRQMAKD